MMARETSPDGPLVPLAAKPRPAASGWRSLLLLANLALGGLVYVLATVDIDALLPHRLAQPPSQGLPGVDERAPTLPLAADVAELQDTLNRPLFRHDRRPYVAPPPPPPVVAPPPAAAVAPPPPPPPPEPTRAPPSVRLAGIAAIGGRPRALLRSKAEPSGEWRTAGETVDGWRIERIGRSEVEFSAGKQRFVLPLEASRSDVGTPAAK